MNGQLQLRVSGLGLKCAFCREETKVTLLKVFYSMGDAH